jgi:hypothetical protein
VREHSYLIGGVSGNPNSTKAAVRGCWKGPRQQKPGLTGGCATDQPREEVNPIGFKQPPYQQFRDASQAERNAEMSLELTVLSLLKSALLLKLARLASQAER